MVETQEAWEAPFPDAFDEDTQSFPFGTNSLYANPDCTVRIDIHTVTMCLCSLAKTLCFRGEVDECQILRFCFVVDARRECRADAGARQARSTTPRRGRWR